MLVVWKVVALWGDHAADVYKGGKRAQAALRRRGAPPPEGRGAELAMARALRRGARAPKDVQYINGHGTGTPLNDAAEAHGKEFLAAKAAELEAIFDKRKAAVKRACCAGPGYWLILGVAYPPNLLALPFVLPPYAWHAYIS